jgi:nucleoside-diphosphate-sugar epimerase
MDKPEISILDLAERTIEVSRKLFNYRGNLIMKSSDDKNYLTDNPNRRCPTIDKAIKDLGFNPKINLSEGLEKSLLWYFDNAIGEDL